MTRAGAGRSRRDAPPAAGRDRAAFTRQQLWQALQPVTLANCELQRYGEAHDGGYLVCANLHMSNFACTAGQAPCGAWACEVLFVPSPGRRQRARSARLSGRHHAVTGEVT